MNTTLLGLALLGAAFGVSSNDDDEIISNEEHARRTHASSRERDRNTRRAEDRVRGEAKRAGYKYKSNRSDNARIIRERRRDPVYSSSAKKGRGGVINLNVRGQSGSREEVETAIRIAADARIDRDIEKLRKAINKGKKTTARRAAQQLRITVANATNGPNTKLARRVLKIAEERGMS